MFFTDFKKCLCCFIPGLCTRKDLSECRLNVECGKELMKKFCRNQSGQYYAKKREKILSGIKLDYSRMVIISNTSCSTYHSKIVDRLKEYGKYRIVKDGWIAYPSKEQIWLDTVVEFTRKIDAQRAVSDLRRKTECISIAMLENVVKRLVDCEVLQPDLPDIATKIKIFKRYRLKEAEYIRLHKDLHTYGFPSTFLLNNRFDRKDVVCEATYYYVTHAYLATLFTNGTYLSREGIVFPGDAITTELQIKTDREKDIIQEFKRVCSYIL